MNKTVQNSLRALPGVETLLNEPSLLALQTRLPRSLVTGLVRQVLAEEREALLDAHKDAAAKDRSDELSTASTQAADLLVQRVCARADALVSPTLRPAINASGVLLHTNLGRSVLPKAALEALAETHGSFSTLEYDLQAQGRGSRHDHIEKLICALTGAEAALVVNNNAAAVLLVLSALARGGEVVVSRGELVEIGGSFRIPDIMEQSGADLVEVGTTNRTKIKDYARALSERTCLIAKVHPSNYLISGFTHAATVEELSALAKERGIPLYFDQGTGLLLDLDEVLPPDTQGSWDEPTVSELLERGCDLVSFSGDKLLGSVQAGLIVGKRDQIDCLKAHPLTRALRLDKLSLTALAQTLKLYFTTPLETIPTLRMLSLTSKELLAQTEILALQLTKMLDPSVLVATVVTETGRVGGGTLPGLELVSPALALAPLRGSADKLASWLVHFKKQPIITRIKENRVLLDLRTVQGEDERSLICEALAGYCAAHALRGQA